MSVAMIRRRWLRGVVAGLVAMGMVGGAVGVASEVRGRVHGRSLWHAVSDVRKEEREARWNSELRDAGFATAREEWIRGPLQAAVERALPGVVLENVECRATMCRWSYVAPDEFSAYGLVMVRWATDPYTSIHYSAEVLRVTVLTQVEPHRDEETLAWFANLTPEVVRQTLFEWGRIDPRADELVDEWERAHPGR